MKNKRVYFRLIPIAGAMIMAFMLLMFNMAQISDGVITPEHADYLRKKFLFGGKQ